MCVTDFVKCILAYENVATLRSDKWLQVWLSFSLSLSETALTRGLSMPGTRTYPLHSPALFRMMFRPSLGDGIVGGYHFNPWNPIGAFRNLHKLGLFRSQEGLVAGLWKIGRRDKHVASTNVLIDHFLGRTNLETPEKTKLQNVLSLHHEHKTDSGSCSSSSTKNKVGIVHLRNLEKDKLSIKVLSILNTQSITSMALPAMQHIWWIAYQSGAKVSRWTAKELWGVFYAMKPATCCGMIWVW